MSTLAPDRLKTTPQEDVDFHTPPSVEEVLRKARDFYDSPDKWVKGQWETPEGQMCMDRALFRFATNEHGVRFILQYLAAQDALREAIGTPLLVAWNDRPNREFDDVLRALDTAIYNECHRS